MSGNTTVINLASGERLRAEFISRGDTRVIFLQVGDVLEAIIATKDTTYAAWLSDHINRAGAWCGDDEMADAVRAG